MELSCRAPALAARIAASLRLAVQALKAGLRRSAFGDASFLEKRPPVFVGR